MVACRLERPAAGRIYQFVLSSTFAIFQSVDGRIHRKLRCPGEFPPPDFYMGVQRVYAILKGP